MQRAEQEDAAPAASSSDPVRPTDRAEASGPEQPQGRAGDRTDRSTEQTARRRLPGGWGTALAVLLGVLAGVLLFLPHRGGWVGHNGDHYYYASTALQYAGVGYDESLHRASEYFQYPDPATRLDLGYLDPAVAPLIYPRVVLGLVAVPAIHRYGLPGIWAPGLIFGSVGVALLIALARRQLGRAGVILVPALIGVTGYACEFMFGIYLEAPVILAAAAMLLTFPLGTARRGWWYAVAAAGLVPVMMLSRQVPLLPLGMALGGWLWAWIGTRRVRNRWLPFAATITPVTVASYGLVAIWAPYDVLPYLFDKTRTSTTGELIGALPAMWRQTLGADARHLLANDRPIFVVTALGLVGLVLAIRNPLAGVFLGSLGSGVVTELLNGQPNDFRYLSPSLPPLLLLGALAGVWLGRRALHPALRTMGLRGRAWPGSDLLRPEPGAEPRPDAGAGSLAREGSGPQPRRLRAFGALRAPVLAAGVWLTVVGLLIGTVAVHRAAPIEGALSLPVQAEGYSGTWPFTVRSGTLICAGSDYQIWFVSPDGVRYALSGTAMADSLTTPRALELAPRRIRYSWPEIKPLLSVGMRLCGTGRAFQAEAP